MQKPPSTTLDNTLACSPRRPLQIPTSNMEKSRSTRISILSFHSGLPRHVPPFCPFTPDLSPSLHHVGQRSEHNNTSFPLPRHHGQGFCSYNGYRWEQALESHTQSY